MAGIFKNYQLFFFQLSYIPVNRPVSTGTSGMPGTKLQELVCFVMRRVGRDLHFGFLAFPANSRVLSFLEETEKRFSSHKSNIATTLQKMRQREKGKEIRPDSYPPSTTSDTILECISFQSFFLYTTALLSFAQPPWAFTLSGYSRTDSGLWLWSDA